MSNILFMLKDILSTNYVSGERLSGLCDIAIDSKDNISKRKDNFCKVVINFGRHGCVHKLTSYEITKINNARSVYVDTNYLHYFAGTIMPMILNDFVLLTHNSSFSVGNLKSIEDSYIKIYECCQKIIANDSMVKWFGLNMVPHEKCEGIPDGMPNMHLIGISKGSNNSLELSTNTYNLLDEVRDNAKTELVYVNFNLKTHKTRDKVRRILEKNGFKLQSGGKKWKEYINEMSKYKFCISPRGNGIDCYRTWEALYIGCIPIVEKHEEIYTYFKDLPLLWVENYDIITNEYY